MTLPQPGFFYYNICEHEGVTINNGTLVHGNKRTKIDMSKYIATTGFYGNTFSISTDRVICTDTWKNIIHVPLDGVIIDGDNLITHQISSKFKWSPMLHHHLSKYRKNIVISTILSNKHTNYHRIPKPLLFIIIKMFM